MTPIATAFEYELTDLPPPHEVFGLTQAEWDRLQRRQELRGPKAYQSEPISFELIHGRSLLSDIWFDDLIQRILERYGDADVARRHVYWETAP